MSPLIADLCKIVRAKAEFEILQNRTVFCGSRIEFDIIHCLRVRPDRNVSSADIHAALVETLKGANPIDGNVVVGEITHSFYFNGCITIEDYFK